MINSEEIEDIVDETEEERQITTIDAVNFALSGDAVGYEGGRRCVLLRSVVVLLVVCELLVRWYLHELIKPIDLREKNERSCTSNWPERLKGVVREKY